MLVSKTQCEKEVFKMEIKFKETKKIGLHCRFCMEGYPLRLFETQPIKGIVCRHCMESLKAYTDK